MTQILDIDSFEVASARAPKRKTPVNTNPLAFDRNEMAVVDGIAAEIDRNLAIKSLSTYNQFLAFHAATTGMKAALAGDWGGLVGAAETGLKATFEIQAVTPYLICKQDEAKRNLASDQRNSLKEMALRLGHAAPAKTEIESDLARCLRAMTCAAICADRGLIHYVKDNFGHVLATIAAEGFGARDKVVLTPAAADLARRFRNARVRMP